MRNSFLASALRALIFFVIGAALTTCALSAAQHCRQHPQLCVD